MAIEVQRSAAPKQQQKQHTASSKSNRKAAATTKDKAQTTKAAQAAASCTNSSTKSTNQQQKKQKKHRKQQHQQHKHEKQQQKQHKCEKQQHKQQRKQQQKQWDQQDAATTKAALYIKLEGRSNTNSDKSSTNILEGPKRQVCVLHNNNSKEAGCKEANPEQLRPRSVGPEGRVREEEERGPVEFRWYQQILSQLVGQRGLINCHIVLDIFEGQTLQKVWVRRAAARKQQQAAVSAQTAQTTTSQEVWSRKRVVPWKFGCVRSLFFWMQAQFVICFSRKSIVKLFVTFSREDPQREKKSERNGGGEGWRRSREGPRKVAPKGGPERWGPGLLGPEEWRLERYRLKVQAQTWKKCAPKGGGAQNFALFRSPATVSFFLSRGRFVEFWWWPRPSNVHVWSSRAVV